MITQSYQTKLALGSDVTLLLVGDADEAVMDKVLQDLWYAIYSFEQRFSRFVPNSELSAFNRAAGSRLPISPEFRDILIAARQLGDESNGLYNPLILPALHRAGYKNSFVEAYKDDIQEDYSKRSVVPVERLEIGDTWASIPYGTALDLGGCGKGYLADLLANTVVPSWLQGYWLSFGGDVIGQGLDNTGKPWTVAITSAFNGSTSKRVLQTDGRRFAAATSGTTIRRGNYKGKNWHHIIDPRTLRPSDSDLSMATVFGYSAVRADVLASCAIILGSNEAPQFLKDHDVQTAYLQGRDNMKRIELEFGSALRPAPVKRRKKVLANA
ncbi:MAG: FAD:protein FMN transferase [Candidatus Saccharimonadales bacterium]